MPDFEFRALAQDGQVTSGSESGESKEAVVRTLQARGLSVLDVRESGGISSKPAWARNPTEGSGLSAAPALTAAAKAPPFPTAKAVEVPASKSKVAAPPVVSPAPTRTFKFTGFGQVSEKALVVFTRQLASTLHAGLPLLRSLNMLGQQTSSRRLSQVINQVGNGIQQGMSFSRALSAHGSIFSDLYLSMIQVGETTGSLPLLVDRLADLLEADMALRQKVRSALAYPCFVLGFSTVLLYLMVACLLPYFVPILEGAGVNIAEKYPLTEFLIKASHLATNAKAMGLLLGSIALLILALRFVYRSSRGRLLVDGLVLRLPVISQLKGTAAVARFARTFGTLIASGVPIVESLSHVGHASGNAQIARYMQQMGVDIQSGGRISVSLSQISAFPSLLVQMVSVGEETGTLDAMFARVADYYDRELQSRITTATALLEPLFMVFVGSAIFIFVLGIMLPILGISQAVNT